MYKGHKQVGCASCRRLIKHTAPKHRIKDSFQEKLSKLHKEQQQKKLPPKKRTIKVVKAVSSSASPPRLIRAPPQAQRAIPQGLLQVPMPGAMSALISRARSINTNKG